MRLLALPVLLSALLVCGSGAAAIRLDRAVAGISLEMSPAQVRAKLGAPDAVVPGRWRVGSIARTYRYATRRVTVDFLLGGQSRLYAYAITTTSPRERTAKGAGVGSTEGEIRRLVTGRACRWEHGTRYCTRPLEGGVGGTTFRLRGGRAVAVTVFAPAF